MASDVRCPRCGAEIDPRGCHGHLLFKHGVEDGTKDDFEPVRSQLELDKRTERALRRELF